MLNRPRVRRRGTTLRNALLPAALAVALALVPALADAQALPGLSSVRVTYNTRKATTNPQGELKAPIDAVDKEITAAMGAGNIGETRRQLALGLALLAGAAWTPALDCQNSLVIRGVRTVVDSSAPYSARLDRPRPSSRRRRKARIRSGDARAAWNATTCRRAQTR